MMRCGHLPCARLAHTQHATTEFKTRQTSSRDIFKGNRARTYVGLWWRLAQQDYTRAEHGTRQEEGYLQHGA